MSESEVLIVGGGLAGLSCALHLHQKGVPCRVLEASQQVGGRARTDELDGFLLDRGFQVLLTAYPEAERVLDYDDLQLARFEPGALIRFQGKFHRFADPWRRPRHLIGTALSPVASLSDKLRVARLRRRVCLGTLEQLYQQPERTTLEALQGEGFSERIIECFFQPFLGGVFLDPQLETSSRLFEFVFRMFALGDAAIPSQGMGAIARQMAARLPEASVQTNALVEEVRRESVSLQGGQSLTGRAVVVACHAPAAEALLDGKPSTAGRRVSCVYFAADQPPVREPVLVLNGEGQGPINNLCVPSQVAPSYAPAGQSLISATAIGVDEDDDTLENRVRSQLKQWFGPAVDRWRHLRSYRIPFALPKQIPPSLTPVAKSCHREDGIFVCGDYLDTASIQGAMISGRRAAEEILASA